MEGEYIEGRYDGGIEPAIYGAVDGFNKREISRGGLPATAKEIMRALACALRSVTIYLQDPSWGEICGLVNHDECDEVSIEAITEAIEVFTKEEERASEPDRGIEQAGE